ncbi:hypothetical protein FBU30_002162 [Linnemannia zychae]|nr:hypothetical protein FBU30_002162 [Linnemannia zychae]
MDLPHQHRYQDHSSAKVFFESCLDTFESIPTAPSQHYPSPSPSSSSISSSETLVNPQQLHNIDSGNKHNNYSTMDRHSQQQQQQQQHNQPPTPSQEVTSSSSPAGPIDFSGPYGPVSTTNMPLAPMAPVYPLLAQALEREGFPGLASMLAYTHDQHQLEQVTVQSALEHQYSMSSSSAGYHQNDNTHPHPQVNSLQQQEPLRGDTYLLDFVMAQNTYNPVDTTATVTSSSSTAHYPQEQTMLINNNPTDPTNNDPALQGLLGEMAPIEVMQYNSLLLDGQFLDALRYSVNTPGSGGCEEGIDSAAWCDAPNTFPIGPNGIFDQFSHVIQPSQQQGYFNPSISSSSGSSSAGSSSAGSSSSAGNFGFNLSGWGNLFHQSEFLDRKREGADMPGQAMMPGAVIAPRIDQAFEAPEADDSEDEDDPDSGDEENSNYPADDNIVPPLSLPKRNARRASQRDEEESLYQQQHYLQQQQHSQHYQHQAQPQHLHQPQHQQNHISYNHHGQYNHHSNLVSTSTSSHPQQSYEHHSAPSSKRARLDLMAVNSASNGQRHSPGHSRNSSVSSVHSLLTSLEHNVYDPSSSSKAGPSVVKGVHSSSSGTSSKFSRPQSDTIEKRMHPCTFEGCDKSFTRAFNLRSHVNTHNGERPHKCPEPGCDWDFVRRHDLDRHVKSKHLANKPYACSHCTSRFGRSDALQRHRRLENHF